MILPQGNRRTGLIGFIRLSGIMCLMVFISSWVQLSAQTDFTADDTLICEGETITFTNLTGISPVDSVTWIFGPDAVPDTITLNPATLPVDITYTSAGIFTVILVVHKPGADAVFEKTGYITVNPLPGKPVIAGPSKVCPLSVNIPYSVTDHSGHSFDWQSTGGGISGSSDIYEVNLIWGPGPSGTLQVTDIIDSSGCEAVSDVFEVEIADDTPPVATCTDTTVYLNSGGNAFIDSTFIDGGITDNCGSIKSISLDKTAFNCSDPDLSPVSISVTIRDEAGNTAVCNSNITVLDTISPLPDIINSVTLYLNGTGEVDLNSSTVDAGSIDNCGIQEITVAPDHYECTDTGNNIATVSIRDIHSNTVERQINVIIRDTIRPIVTILNDTLHGCDTGSIPGPAYSELETTLNMATFLSLTGATLQENCGIDSITYQDSQSGSCPLTITRTFRVTDVNGNLAVKDQTILIHDSIAPLVTPPSDYDIEGCNTSDITDLPYSESEEPVSLAQFQALPGAAVTEDCNLTITYQDEKTGFCPVIVTRTFRFTDDCGNTASVQQVIRINDTAAPVATPPADTVVEGCTTADFVFPPYTEMETPIAYLDYMALPGASLIEDCPDSILFHDVISDIFGLEITRTFRIKDGCSHQVTVAQQIVIEDTIAPDFTPPADITICRAAGCTYDADPVAVTGVPTGVTDNCFSQVTFSDDLTNLADCDHYGYISREWKANDNRLNERNKYQTIYIEPVPRVQLVPASGAYCNNDSISVQITSPTVPEFPVNFRYSYVPDYTDSINVIYNSPGQTGLPEGFTIDDNIENLGMEVHSVLLIVTPYTIDENGIERCSGIADTSVIWVNPSALMSVTADDRLCSTDEVSFDVTMQNGTITGNWYYDVHVVYPYAVTGDWAGGISGQDLTGADVLFDHLVNTSDSVKTIVYEFIPFINVGGNACEGITELVNVDIYPAATMETSVEEDVLCFNGNAVFSITNTTAAGAWKYDISVAYPAGVNGNLNGALNDHTATGAGILTDHLTNTTNDVQTVTYTFTPHIDPGGGRGECFGNPVIIAIEINPRPQIQITTDGVLCYDENAVFDITSLNTVNGGGEWRYDIDATYPLGVTGDLIAGLDNQVSEGPGVFTDHLINTADEVKTVIYSFTPHINPGGGGSECLSGTPVVINVKINPRPGIVISADTIICYDGNAEFNITNPNTYSPSGQWRYNITASYPGGVTGNWGAGLSDLNSTGIGVLTDNLTNTTDDDQIVTYTFTPHIDPGDGDGECQDGSPEILSIKILPRPEIGVTADLVICHDGDAVFSITTPNTVDLPAEWRYNISVAYPVGVSGNWALGLVDQTVTGVAALTDNLINTTNDVLTVIYTFTPFIIPGDGTSPCEGGIPVVINMEINPQPKIQAITDEVLCYDGDASFDITNPNTVNTIGEWRYDVTVSYPGGVTGDWTGGLSDVTSTGLSALTDNLTNTTDDVQTVTYTFTPHIDPGDGGGECGGGVPVVINVEINPQPKIQVATDEILCYDGDAAFDITNPNSVNTTGEWRYNVTVNYPAGVSGDWAGGLNNMITTGLSAITDDLTNTTNDVQTVTYTFTPHIEPGDGGSDCGGGVPVVVNVEINPQPKIQVITDEVLCYDGDASFDITNPNTVNTIGEWRYDVTVNYPGGVTGDWTGGLSDVTATGLSALTDNLTNTTDDVQTVTYTFTPHIEPGDGGGECANGIPVVIEIEINPQPKIQVTTDEILCYDGDAAFDITRPNTVNAAGEWRYDVTVNYPAGVTGDWTGGLSNVTSTGLSAITDDLTNTTDDVQTVTYTFTPHIEPGDGGGDCAGGVPVVVNIEINPQPKIQVTTDEILCFDGDAAFDITNPNSVNITGEWRYDVSVVYPLGVTGDWVGGILNETASGLSALTDNLSNTTDDVQTVTYTFTPHIDPGDGGGDCADGVPVVMST